MVKQYLTRFVPQSGKQHCEFVAQEEFGLVASRSIKSRSWWQQFVRSPIWIRCSGEGVLPPETVEPKDR
jgi:hypothetical protein